MSDMAKQARAAMKAKAKSLTTADPHQKVDSSTWSPPEPLNTTAKTGMRPVSRRAFKSGGKVEGEKAKCNMGRKPRKSGGEATSWVNAKINRNVKDANEEREGIKHVGGMKKGGRLRRDDGGKTSYKDEMGTPIGRREYEAMQNPPFPLRGMQNGRYTDPGTLERAKDVVRTVGNVAFSRAPAAYGDAAESAKNALVSGAGKAKDYISGKLKDFAQMEERGYKKGGRTAKQNGGGMSSGRGILTKNGKDVVGPTSMQAIEENKAPPIPQRPQRAPEKGMTGEEASEFMKARKSGGRAKKAGGGELEMYGKGVSGAADMMKKAANRAGVPGGLYGSGFTRVGAGKLSPAGAAVPMTRMKKGGMTKHSDEAMDRALFKKMEKEEHKKEGHEDEAMDVALIKKMVKPSARTARKSGGRTKGKTNINIVIAAGKPAGQGDMMPPGGPTLPPGMGAAPGGLPIPVPAAGGAPGGAPMPMPMPMPAPAPAAGPAPTPRRDGGRLTKRASSYKDMEAGAGSGEGRLQKTDIAKRIPKPTENGVIGTTNLGYPNKVPGATGGRTARKAGGKAYRSYKDMDAGAGSGMGRLEKTEIQARKG